MVLQTVLPKWFMRKEKEEEKKIYFGISDEIPKLENPFYCLRINSSYLNEGVELGPVIIQLSEVKKLDNNLNFVRSTNGDVYIVRTL